MRTIGALTVAGVMTLAVPGLHADRSTDQNVTVATKEIQLRVRRALERLPYLGVFDFVAFSVDKGTVTLSGYAYRPSLPKEAERAVKSVAGVDEVANKLEVLPVSQLDDDIRWSTYYRIYTDDFLSRYAPGGPMAVRYELLNMRRFPGMQPLGTHPIHIIVKNRAITLVGVVDSEADKTMAGFRAREVSSSSGVENELMVEGRRK